MRISEICKLWETGKYFECVRLNFSNYESSSKEYNGLIERVVCEGKEYTIALYPNKIIIYDKDDRYIGNLSIDLLIKIIEELKGEN